MIWLINGRIYFDDSECVFDIVTFSGIGVNKIPKSINGGYRLVICSIRVFFL